jgi:hypothetical protein
MLRRADRKCVEERRANTQNYEPPAHKSPSRSPHSNGPRGGERAMTLRRFESFPSDREVEHFTSSQSYLKSHPS